MTRADFIVLLEKASAESVMFARQFVRNHLPEAYHYHVVLNQSFDGNATPEQRVYPEDDEREHICASADGVADVLWRHGCCPEWIDVFVESEGTNYTLLQLLCCGRYSEDQNRMYYRNGGMGPFGIKSPILPPGHVVGDTFTIPRVQPIA